MNVLKAPINVKIMLALIILALIPVIVERHTHKLAMENPVCSKVILDLFFVQYC